MSASETLRGKVKFFNSKKGFGFIADDGRDYFLHVTSIDGDYEPLEGDLVEFSIGRDRSGRERAVNVKILSK